MYTWEGGPALVQTVDFFTPIVDDPYLYGQIAAANSVSDVYAMGGQPRTALAIAAFPGDGLEPGVISTIFRGGYDKLQEAGVALLGGHTVQDPEIKFGYAITGAVDPKRLLTNRGALPGDTLIQTKPLGTGIVATAIKKGRAPADLVDRAVASMVALNRTAAETMAATGGAHACTDITGFGLIGHASEMASASGVTLEFTSAEVPVLEGVMPLVPGGRSGGMATNRHHFARRTRMADSVGRLWQDLLYDPQTSGGLLIAVASDIAPTLLAALQNAGVGARAVGRVLPAETETAPLVSVV